LQSAGCPHSNPSTASPLAASADWPAVIGHLLPKTHSCSPAFTKRGDRKWIRRRRRENKSECVRERDRERKSERKGEGEKETTREKERASERERERARERIKSEKV